MVQIPVLRALAATAALLVVPVTATASTGTARFSISPAGAAPRSHVEFRLPPGYRQLVGALGGNPVIGGFRRSRRDAGPSGCVDVLEVFGRAQHAPPVRRGNRLQLVKGREPGPGARSKYLSPLRAGRTGALRWYVGPTWSWPRTGPKTATSDLYAVAVFRAPSRFVPARTRWAVVTIGQSTTCRTSAKRLVDELARAIRTTRIVAGRPRAAPGVPVETAQTTPSLGGRIHSRIVTRDRGIVLVPRLQLAVRPAGAGLRATVTATVANTARRVAVRDLRVGSCTGGNAQYPNCPSSRSIRLRLRPRERRTVRASVALPRPSVRRQAVEAAVVAVSDTPPYSFGSEAELLLTAPAWLGLGAGRTYGVRFASADAARRLNFDVPLTAPDRARIDVRWQGTAAPSGATTTIGRCRTAGCRVAVLRPSPSRSRPGTFGTRPGFLRNGADWLTLRAAVPAGSTLFEAALPWPV